jgi:hypothetical protein
MLLGMSLSTFTTVHVIISLLAIVSGLVAVLVGMLKADRMPRWTAFFLITTILTSVTGFMFPATKLLPSHIVGIISLLLLALALFALYGKHLAGTWRAMYVVTAVISLYLNVFVLVVQSFLKVASLHALAPTGTETPFKVAQGVVLLLFVAIGWAAVKKFRPALAP